MGHGWAPAVTALEYDLPIGLSSDVATTAPSDQFTQMRSIFGSERGRKHQESWDADLDGLEASPGLITSRQVLSWATIGGAEVAGIADRTGSLTPGQAGRHRDHRRVGRERRADHRPGRGGRLRRGRLERQDGHRGRRDAQGRLPAQGLARRAAQGASRRRATTSSRSSAIRNRAGWSRPPPSASSAATGDSPGVRGRRTRQRMRPGLRRASVRSWQGGIVAAEAVSPSGLPVGAPTWARLSAPVSAPNRVARGRWSGPGGSCRSRCGHARPGRRRLRAAR